MVGISSKTAVCCNRQVRSTGIVPKLLNSDLADC